VGRPLVQFVMGKDLGDQILEGFVRGEDEHIVLAGIPGIEGIQSSSLRLRGLTGGNGKAAESSYENALPFLGS